MKAYRVQLTAHKAGYSWRTDAYTCYVGAMNVDSACTKTRTWARRGRDLVNPVITLVEEISANIVG